MRTALRASSFPGALRRALIGSVVVLALGLALGLLGWVLAAVLVAGWAIWHAADQTVRRVAEPPRRPPAAR